MMKEMKRQWQMDAVFMRTCVRTTPTRRGSVRRAKYLLNLKRNFVGSRARSTKLVIYTGGETLVERRI